MLKKNQDGRETNNKYIKYNYKYLIYNSNIIDNMEELEKKMIEFAIKNNIIQGKYINYLENDNTPFNKKEYNEIHNKNYVEIINKNNEFFLDFGKILVEVDSIDEDDFYFIDKEILFSIPILNETINSENVLNDFEIKYKQLKNLSH